MTQEQFTLALFSALFLLLAPLGVLLGALISAATRWANAQWTATTMNVQKQIATNVVADVAQRASASPDHAERAAMKNEATNAVVASAHAAKVPVTPEVAGVLVEAAVVAAKTPALVVAPVSGAPSGRTTPVPGES